MARILCILVICAVLLASCTATGGIPPAGLPTPTPAESVMSQASVIQAIENIQKVDTGMSEAQIMDIYADEKESDFPVRMTMYQNVLTCYYTFIPLVSYKPLGWAEDTPDIKQESYDGITYGMTLSQVESTFGGRGLKFFGYTDPNGRYKEKYTGYYWRNKDQYYCIFMGDGKAASKAVITFDGHRLQMAKTCLSDEKFYSTFPIRYEVYNAFNSATREKDIVSILGEPESTESGNGRVSATWRLPLGTLHEINKYLAADHLYLEMIFDAKSKKLLYKRIGCSAMSLSRDFLLFDDTSQQYSAILMSHTGAAGMQVSDIERAQKTLKPGLSYEDTAKALGNGGLLLNEYDIVKEYCWTQGDRVLKVTFKQEAGKLTLTDQRIIDRTVDIYEHTLRLTLLT